MSANAWNLIEDIIKDDLEQIVKKDTGKLKWIKRIKIREGITNKKKLSILSDILKRFFHYGKRDRQVRGFALRILHHYKIRPKDHINEVRTIQRWVQKNIRYTFDPYNVEYFQSARRQLWDWKKKMSGSDCDDQSILTVSMLGSIGYHCYLLLLDSRGDGVYSHAMAGVKFPKPYPPYGTRIVPVELTKQVPLGWQTPKATKVFIIDMEKKQSGFEKHIGYISRETY